MRSQKYQNNRGMIFIGIIVGMLIFSALGIATVSMVSNSLEDSTDNLESAQAFYVAEGGMHYLLMNQLNGDSNFSDNTSPTDIPFGANSIELEPGEFWIEYLNQESSSTDIRITARVGNAIRVIEQSVSQGGSGYQYVTMAGGNLNASNSTGSIFGDVGLQGNATISPGISVNGNIIEDPTLEMPTMDLQVYKNMTTSTYSGNKTFNSSQTYTDNLYVTGNVTFQGSVTFNGILYVGGDVNFNGDNVTINGTIVAEGNIDANKDDISFISQQTDPAIHMPAIVSEGNLSFTNSENLYIHGVAWNPGNIQFNNADNMTFQGSFIAGGNVILNSIDNLTLTFDSDLLAGVPGLQGVGATTSGSLSVSNWRSD